MTSAERPRSATTKLAVITSTWPRNPHDISGRFLLELVSALALPCEIVCPADDAHGPPAMPSAPLQLFGHRGLFYGEGALGNLASQRIGPLALAHSLSSMLRAAITASRRCDIIFSHWAVPGGLVGALCRRILAKPHVLLLHSADVFWLEQHRLGHGLAGFIADHCDALCGVSESVVERFEALSGRRGRVLGCGIPMIEPSAGSPDIPRVGSLSRLVAGKGVRRLVQLAPSLPGELRIAGAGPLSPEVAGLCAESEGARFDGPRLEQDKHRWLRQLDVFAAPSTGMPWGQPEGLPVSVLEAQAAGLPVVAFSGALPEGLVRDGQNGRLVRPGDWSGYAATLAELLRDPQQRRTLGDAARRDAAAYEISRVARQWALLFDRVRSRGRRGAARPSGGLRGQEEGC